MIICDSREKKNANVLGYFLKKNIPFLIKKLETGDYMNSEKMNVTIDRKRNLQELCTNLFSKDSSRFWKEIRRSKDEHIKMYILCEHGGNIKSIKDVCNWRNNYGSVTGKKLMEEIYRVHIAYGIEFVFCDKRSTGKKILELLNYDT